MFCSKVRWFSLVKTALHSERLIFNDFTNSYLKKGTNIYNKCPLLNCRSRNLETLSHIVAPTTTAKALTKEDKREFMAVFPDLVRDLTEMANDFDTLDVKNWYAKVLQYNVSGGKRLRGLNLVYSYRMLASPEDLTPENVKLSQILGWCVEMLQGFFLVIDDVLDQSETRRGRPCWYKQPEIGLRAINDGLLIESGIFQLLKKYFHDKPYYMKLIELFHETSLMTEFGQTLDFITASVDGQNGLEKFTMDRYNNIVKYKTSYYTFHLPIALAMHMAAIEDDEKHRQAKSILLEMGHFFQVQDDFMDVFGDPEVTGKVGTDIQDGKCTWLAVVALQRSTPEQWQIMKDSYGSPDPVKIATVKNLYTTLGLPSIYAAYEEESYNILTTRIQQMSRGMPDDLFFALLSKIYKRVN